MKNKIYDPIYKDSFDVNEDVRLTALEDAINKAKELGANSFYFNVDYDVDGSYGGCSVDINRVEIEFELEREETDEEYSKRTNKEEQERKLNAAKQKMFEDIKRGNEIQLLKQLKAKYPDQ